MQKLKYGAAALLSYSLLAFAAYVMAVFWDWHGGVIYSIAFILTTIIWYEASSQAFRRDMTRGVWVILAYVIPSLIISYLYYGAMGDVALISSLYEVFHLPLVFGLNAAQGLDNLLLNILFPSFMILILAIYPFSRSILKAFESQHTQYILR